VRTLVLSTVIGARIGAAAMEALHAQAKPPVYMIAINEIKDPESYQTKFAPTAQKTVKDHGGTYIAAGQATLIDGAFPKGRMTIVRWENLDALNSWRHSRDYEEIRKVGESFANFNLVVVDGVPQ
jgi:uncharacterized protein (DUF1330 family)